jgi:hypothetical protein
VKGSSGCPWYRRMAYDAFMQRCITFGCMLAVMTTGSALAQTNECVPPDAGLAIAGAVRDFNVPPSAACRAADYSTSYGPIIDYKAAERAAPAPVTSELPAALPQVVRPKPTGPELGSGEGVDLYDLESGTGGTMTNYNGRELERLGELDAMQGKPLNMDRADDVNYVRGYTKGNERRIMPKPWR